MMVWMRASGRALSRSSAGTLPVPVRAFFLEASMDSEEANPVNRRLQLKTPPLTQHKKKMYIQQQISRAKTRTKLKNGDMIRTIKASMDVLLEEVVSNQMNGGSTRGNEERC
jgi:hypothetical protein